MTFNTFYTNRPKPVCCKPDTETKFVDQSEADRASLQYQLERYGFDSLQQQLEKTKAQFGYADTRLTPSFTDLSLKMAEANSYFMALPAQLRKKFNHSAVEFFSEIEKNPEKMWKDGYISKKLAGDLGVESAIDKPVVVEPTISVPISTTEPVTTQPVENPQVSA